MADSPLLRLAIHRIRPIHLRERYMLLGALGGPSMFAKLSRSRFEEIIGRRTRMRIWEPVRWLSEATADEKNLTDGTFKCTFYGEPDYPPLLTEIHNPPFVLFYRGTLPKSDNPALCIVGTRRPSGSGRKSGFAL